MIATFPFYLIRHGQTDSNVARIMQGGYLDTPLNATGEAQAEYLRKVIHTLDRKPVKIFHSPLQRARKTATVINQALNLAIHEIDDLREHIVGDWEGAKWDEIKPRLLAGETPPNGESRSDYAERVKKTLHGILPHHDSPVMIVAHGGTFAALAHLHGFDFGHIPNCHLHYFEPHPDNAAFPWKIWQYDPEGGTLIKRKAAISSS
jgi:broad specificity phosphatase PhoE